MTEIPDLPERLEFLLSANPDVEIVYSAHTAVREIASHAIGELVGSPQEPHVVVSQTSDGTSVAVSVGVTGERSAAEVARTLHSLLTAELVRAAVTPPVHVAVKVSSIA